MATPTINVVEPSGTASNATSIASTIVGVPAGDIVVVAVNFGTTVAEGQPTVSSVTATGVTFTQRAVKAIQGVAGVGSQQRTELWWAPVATGPFTQTVTVTFSAQTDDCTLHLFSVSGAKTSNPWNGVSATTDGVAAGSSTAETAFSAPTGSLAILAGGSNGNTAAPFTNPTTGFTQMNRAANTGGSEFEFSGVAYQALVAPLVGATVGWTDSASFWTLIADAMVAGGSPGTSDPNGTTVQAELNRLANGGTYPPRTKFLAEAGAANKYAGTTGLATVGALNVKAGISSRDNWLDLQGVANKLAGTSGLGAAEALRRVLA